MHCEVMNEKMIIVEDLLHVFGAIHFDSFNSHDDASVRKHCPASTTRRQWTKSISNVVYPAAAVAHDCVAAATASHHKIYITN